ncbi:MAG: helix-turn-helix transcriptional regulator [Alphaproteobacteria bacterium]|nr:helix-turn-helix transcriptional regulator [Alphaproteobacteria bacterium]
MQQIHGTQIRAARAILDWSQGDLAERTGLGVTTIRNFEDGFVPRGKTAEIIRAVFENGGVEFTEREGVRRCVDEIKILYEPNSCREFFNDIMQTIRADGAEILACVSSYEVFTKSCDIAEKDGIERLKKLSNFAKIKCLVPNTENKEPALPMVEFRQTNLEPVGPSQYYVYGNKYALVMSHGRDYYRFVVLQSPSLAYSFRTHFLTLWNNTTLKSSSIKS